MPQVLKKMINLKRNIKLFFQSPIEFLWSYTYPTDKKIKIFPYDPDVNKTGKNLKNLISKNIPGLTVYLIGSAAFKISGQRDIDLIALSDPKHFPKYLPGLVRLFGNADKTRKEFVEWHFTKNGCEIELILGDPNSRVCRGPLKSFNILSSNKSLLKEYEQIKLKSNGLSMREYKRVRLEFFNRIIRENKETK